MHAVFPLVKKYGGTVRHRPGPGRKRHSGDRAGPSGHCGKDCGDRRRLRHLQKGYCGGRPGHDHQHWGPGRRRHPGNPAAPPGPAGCPHLPRGLQRLLRPASAGKHQRGLLHYGFAERPERHHHQPQFRGYDAGVFQLLCAGRAEQRTSQDYIARYAGQTTAAPAAAKGDLPLQECIRKGLKEQTAAATAALFKTTAPLDVMDQELIPALDVVGKGFEGRRSCPSCL